MLRELQWRQYIAHCTVFVLGCDLCVKPCSRLGLSYQRLSQFLYHEAARSISTPRGQDGSPSQVTPHNLLGFSNNSLAPIYAPGLREALWELSVLPKNTTQCPWPGLEPRLLTSGTIALTMRPQCLSLGVTYLTYPSSFPLEHRAFWGHRRPKRRMRRNNLCK